MFNNTDYIPDVTIFVFVCLNCEKEFWFDIPNTDGIQFPKFCPLCGKE